MVKEKKNSVIKIVFAGDYHIYGDFDKFIKKHSLHNVFAENVLNIISQSHLSLFNLEDPITSKKRGIIKYGPHGVGSEESLAAIKKVGFALTTFATNHTYDMGDQGIDDTISACRRHGIDVIGAGLTRNEARKIYYKKIDKYNIAILNFSRVEFNTVTDDHGGANPLDVIENVRDIKEAKNEADFVFVVVHEGVDVFHLPYPKLVKQMRFYADMGADAILLHHSRIISGYEIYNGTPILYGLGNLVHLSRNPEEHKGLIAEFSINAKRELGFDLIPIKLDPKEILVSICEGATKNQAMQEIERLSLIIQDETTLLSEWRKFVQSKKAFYLSIMVGYPNLFLRIARKLALVPVYEKILLINKRKYLSKWNMMKCQAHHEAVQLLFSEMFEERKE